MGRSCPSEIAVNNRGYSLIEEIESQQENDKAVSRAFNGSQGQPQGKLDSRTEEILSELINQGKGAKSLNKAISVLSRKTPKSGRQEFNRRIEYLVKCGLINRKIHRSKVDGNTSQSEIYTLTYDGERYFETMKSTNLLKAPIEMSGTAQNEPHKYDVFLSHASRDKISYVNQLNKSLRRLGVRVFYDSNELDWGDDWKQRIISGARSAEFAIIVISENFFGREWTEKELKEFLLKQNERNQKTILPILYKIHVKDLCQHYPELESIQCISADEYTKDQIAILFAKELIKRIRSV